MERLQKKEEYLNHEISEIFGCAPQGGMRRSHSTNTLVLISDYTGKNIYINKWHGEILHFSGMGQEGDQALNKFQNKTLAESANNGIEVHLFEKFEDKKYIYAGKVKLVSEPYTQIEKDIKGQDRIIYRFPLKLINSDI